MNNTINVSIAGIAFILENEGYRLLKDYLVRIEVGYKGNPDGPEILSDIEARISELILNEQDADTVVTAERIRTIIGQLGLPDGMDTRTPADNIQADSVPSDNFARRLYRNPDGAKLGGVCNGIATYFRVDPTLVRLIFCSPLLILVCIVCKNILGPVGGIIAIVGVIVLPVTSGDTALRSLRMSLADTFHLEQKSNGKRMMLAVPVFILVAAIIVWAKFNSSGFQTLWRYFAWSNQTLSLFAFLSISVWMFENGKSKWVWIPLIPGCFYTFICSCYLATAEIGFHLPWNAGYIIGVVLAVAYVVAVCAYGSKRAKRVLRAQ